MKKLASLFLILLSLPAQAAPFGKSVSNVTPTAETVTANIASTSNTIPSNFVGFSWEPALFIAGTMQGASATSLESIISQLGPNGVIRVGGTTGDPFVTAPALTQQLATDMATFMAALGSGWSLVYQLDYNVPASQVTHAGYFINAFGVSNVTFAIGNEQALGTAYTNNWNSAYSTLVTAFSSIKFEGPESASGAAVSDIEAWGTGITPGSSSLTYMSYHQYIGSNFYAVPQTIISFALTSIGSSLLTYAPGKVRLGEFNTEFGGFQTVSDRLMAAAWYLNTQMIVAPVGYAGTNLHERGNDALSPGPHLNPTGAGVTCAYSPFVKQLDGNWTPSAIFYGVFLFSKLQGQTIISTTNSGTGTVRAIATLGSGGNANILVVNNDPGRPVVVTPAQSTGAWTTAKVWKVGAASANACYDRSATLNGVTLNESAANMPGALTISNGGTVTIQPCGAALIQIQP